MLLLKILKWGLDKKISLKKENLRKGIKKFIEENFLYKNQDFFKEFQK